MPGLLYASSLVERALGSRILLGAYLVNCIVAASTTALYHRQIGFNNVRLRGQNANNNGNSALFMTALFTALVPHYKIKVGKTMARSLYFYYLLIMYGMLFFT